MVDIDGMVMDACAEFMPNVCGKYLKRVHWDGDNYKVINGCAIQFMKDCLVCFIKLQRGTLWKFQFCHLTPTFSAFLTLAMLNETFSVTFKTPCNIFRLKANNLISSWEIWQIPPFPPNPGTKICGTFWAPFWNWPWKCWSRWRANTWLTAMASMCRNPSKLTKTFCLRFVEENVPLLKRNVTSKVSLKLGSFIKSPGVLEKIKATEKLRDFNFKCSFRSEIFIC